MQQDRNNFCTFQACAGIEMFFEIPGTLFEIILWP